METLGQYRLLGEIGAGGMGVVYRAHDDQLDRDVALKVLPPHSLDDPSARARLLREARTASRLTHPGICTIYQVGEMEGRTYIAMELIEGRPLSSRVAEGPIPAEELLRHGTQLADALAFAHEQGVVHRDLKPANVMLTKQGRIKVLDFGLARRLTHDSSPDGTTAAQLTTPGTVTGTLAYMSPEQLTGRPVDPRSDVWSFGVMFYEMATGERPFQGQTGFELSSAILTHPPRPLPSSIPGELQLVIERCLAKEPEQRYADGGEIRAALEAIQAGSAKIPWLTTRRRTVLRRRAGIAGGSVALLATAGVLLMTLRGPRTEPPLAPPTPQIASIAVLPFQNLSGDHDQAYLADGTHETLITDLAKIRGFQRVIARSSTMRYRNSEKPLPEIARELGVDAVMTGSFTRAGDRVRVSAQLINARTEEHLWAERYERDLRDLLALQNEIVAAITRAVRIRLTPAEAARVRTTRMVDPEAHQEYLRGAFHMNEETPEGFQKGLAHLHEAIRKDPTHPLPHARLALGYTMVGHGPGAPPEAFPRAKAAAVQALALDDSLAEAHAALAEVKLYHEWDWQGAEESFRRALELNPNLADAHAHYAWYLILFGRYDEALAAARRSKEADPLMPLWTAWLGWLESIVGNHDAAIDEANKALELSPNASTALHVLGLGYAGKGMWKEAIAAHERAAAASPFWRWSLGRTYADAGRRDEARRIAAEMQRAKKPDVFGIAMIYAGLDEFDAAMHWLEQAYAERRDWLPWIALGLGFEPMRADPRFQDLLRRMNLTAPPAPSGTARS